MVLVQKWPFFQLFFKRNIGQENVFYDILERKTPFQAIKTRRSKSGKIHIFPKWLTHWFGLKMAVFQTLIFYVIQARKMSFTIFQNEKTPFQTIKTRSSKSRKIEIFPKGLTHSFGPKMALFPTFFQAIQARKVSFKIFYIEKTPLQPIKTKSSKTPKTNIFRNALTHSYGPNWPFFQIFFLRNLDQENVFYDILERKNALLAYKNKKFKKSKK